MTYPESVRSCKELLSQSGVVTTYWKEGTILLSDFDRTPLSRPTKKKERGPPLPTTCVIRKIKTKKNLRV